MFGKQASDNTDENDAPKTPEEGIELTIDNLMGHIKEIDEYEFFKKVIKSLFTSKPEVIRGLISQLSDTQKKDFSQILRSERVSVCSSGQKIDVPRRIAKTSNH